MPCRLSRCALAVVVLRLPSVAAAQGWPEAGVVFTAGITSLDSRGAVAGSAGITRSYGPVVLGGFGEIIVGGATVNGNGVQVDPLNGRLTCNGGRTVTTSQSCLANYNVLGGGLFEAGLSLDPLIPMVISRGYRVAPIGEAYTAVMLHGALSPNGRVGWVARVAVGHRTAQFHGGVRLALELPSP